MRMVIEINDTTHAELKQFAVDHGTTIKHIVLSGARLVMDGNSGVPLVNTRPKAADLSPSAAYSEFMQRYKKLCVSSVQAAALLGFSADVLVSTVKRTIPVDVELLDKLRNISEI